MEENDDSHHELDSLPSGRVDRYRHCFNGGGFVCEVYALATRSGQGKSSSVTAGSRLKKAKSRSGGAWRDKTTSGDCVKCLGDSGTFTGSRVFDGSVFHAVGPDQ